MDTQPLRPEEPLPAAREGEAPGFAPLGESALPTHGEEGAAIVEVAVEPPHGGDGHASISASTEPTNPVEVEVTHAVSENGPEHTGAQEVQQGEFVAPATGEAARKHGPSHGACLGSTPQQRLGDYLKDRKRKRAEEKAALAEVKEKETSDNKELGDGGRNGLGLAMPGDWDTAEVVSADQQQPPKPRGRKKKIPEAEAEAVVEEPVPSRSSKGKAKARAKSKARLEGSKPKSEGRAASSDTPNPHTASQERGEPAAETSKQTTRKRKPKANKKQVEAQEALAGEAPGGNEAEPVKSDLEKAKCTRKRKAKKQQVEASMAAATEALKEGEATAEAALTTSKRKRKPGHASNPTKWSMSKRRRLIKLSSMLMDYEPEAAEDDAWGTAAAWDAYAAACSAVEVRRLGDKGEPSGDAGAVAGGGPKATASGLAPSTGEDNKAADNEAKGKNENAPAPAQASKGSGRTADQKALLSRKSCAYVKERNKRLKAGCTEEVAKAAGRRAPWSTTNAALRS